MLFGFEFFELTDSGNDGTNRLCVGVVSCRRFSAVFEFVRQRQKTIAVRADIKIPCFARMASVVGIHFIAVR